MSLESGPVVSVVIPIYNIESYISKCVESVLSQSYRNLEIILVDDGSTDSSGGICDTYAKTDSRIVVIHKSNGGLSEARNFGIKRASGELLTCIDGDDYVSSRYIEILLSAFKNPSVDLSIVHFKKILSTFTPSTDDFTKDDAKVEVLPRESALERLFLQKGITNSAWGKLYRREFFDDINYPVGYNYEDLPVTYRLLAKANSISVIHEEAYFYVQHSQSITATTKFNKRTHAIGFAEEAVEFSCEEFPSLVAAAQVRAFMEGVFIISQVPTPRSLRTLDSAVVKCLKRNRKAIFQTSSTYRHKIYGVASFLGPFPLWAIVQVSVFISKQKTRSNSV